MDSPFPPAHLVRRVSSVTPDNPYHVALSKRAPWHDVHDLVGTNNEIGRRCADTIRQLLPPGWSFEGKRVLDFGCGIGRTLRHFATDAEVAEMHGCDIDEPSIDWLRENLSPPFHFARTREEPPLPYGDDSFDLVWAISVFTHLTDSWSRWLLEVRRVLRPGGLFVASFSGRGYEVAIAGPPWNESWDEDRIGMNVLLPGNPWDVGGPAVFHSCWWLAEHWGRAFEVLEMRPDGLASVPGMGQGIVLMRNDERPVTVEDLEAPSDDPREVVALVRNREQLAAEIGALRDLVAARERELADAKEWTRDAVSRFEDAQAAYQALRSEYDAIVAP